MLRDTMIRTMPVAMTATDADWTDRFHRLRAVRNDPPDRMLNPIQMTTGAPIRPSRRVSISIDSRIDRIDRAGTGSRLAAGATVLWLIERLPRLPGMDDAPCSAEAAEQGARMTALGVIPTAGGDGPGAVTSLQRSSLVIHPSSMAIWRLALVIGLGRQEDRAHR